MIVPVPVCRFCLVALLLFLMVSPVWAYKKESKIPLIGCRGHYAASGSARYVALRKESKQVDGEELIVEVNNVPLRPGTTLIVYVTDEPVGTIKLDAKQSGSLTLTSSYGKFVPPIEPGTSVVVKTVDGRFVMW